MQRLVAVLATIVVCAVSFGHQVFAHAHISTSHPADGAELVIPPAEIRLTFTENIEAGASLLTLVDERGQVVTGTSQTSPDDATLVLEPPALPAGRYTVEWQVLSNDTHATAGYMTFSVAASAGAAPTQNNAKPQQSQHPSSPAKAESRGSFPWIWVVVAVGVFVLISVAKRRR